MLESRRRNGPTRVNHKLAHQLSLASLRFSAPRSTSRMQRRLDGWNECVDVVVGRRAEDQEPQCQRSGDEVDRDIGVQVFGRCAGQPSRRRDGVRR
jgi:tetrahydromethanopterin S-methyltransferase subunit G